jgi:putative hydrolase of the HAD superfamily
VEDLVRDRDTVADRLPGTVTNLEAVPDRRLFDVAAGQVRDVDRLVMVGDSLVNDVRGAQGAGWLGVWLNREGAPCPSGHRPDAEIETLAALPGTVAALLG